MARVATDLLELVRIMLHVGNVSLLACDSEQHRSGKCRLARLLKNSPNGLCLGCERSGTFEVSPLRFDRRGLRQHERQALFGVDISPP